MKFIDFIDTNNDDGDDDDDNEICFSEDLPEGINLIIQYDRISKSVKLNLNPTIHLMCAWTFAYKQARKGDWEMATRDRCRFQRRIEETREMIDRILESNHRGSVYQSRFQEKK